MGNEAAEKTEEATSRRRSKERERGNVAKSKDMESAMVMIGGIALLGVFAKYMYNNILNMLRETFTNLNPASVDITSIVGILYPYFRYLGLIVLPFFVSLFIFAIITEFIYDIANGNGWFYFKDQNVMFSLLISLFVIVGIRKFSGNLLAQSVFLFAGIFASHFSNADFGTLGYGVILTVLMYTTRGKKLFFNIACPLLTILASIFNGYLLALLAFIPINLYNGRQGFKCTYLFYAIYPVSILILHLIGMIFF